MVLYINTDFTQIQLWKSLHNCMFCMFGVQNDSIPNRFQKMQLTHPNQYSYCINKLGCGKVLDFIAVPYINEIKTEVI